MQKGNIDGCLPNALGSVLDPVNRRWKNSTGVRSLVKVILDKKGVVLKNSDRDTDQSEEYIEANWCDLPYPYSKAVR